MFYVFSHTQRTTHNTHITHHTRSHAHTHPHPTPHPHPAPHSAEQPAPPPTTILLCVECVLFVASCAVCVLWAIQAIQGDAGFLVADSKVSMQGGSRAMEENVGQYGRLFGPCRNLTFWLLLVVFANFLAISFSHFCHLAENFCAQYPPKIAKFPFFWF